MLRRRVTRSLGPAERIIPSVASERLVPVVRGLTRTAIAVSRPRARVPRPAPSPPGRGPLRHPSPHRTDCCRPIRRREGAQGRLRDVRRQAPFPCARCPAVRSALDAGPEAYRNPAAVWWGALHFPRSCRHEPGGRRQTPAAGLPVDGAGGSDHQYAAWSASNQQVLRSTPASSPATNPAP